MFSCSLRSCVKFSGFNERNICLESKAFIGFCRNSDSSHTNESKSKLFPVSNIYSMEKKPVVVPYLMDPKDLSTKFQCNLHVHSQNRICASKGMRWSENTPEPNMVEIHSAQELVDSLVNACDNLTIIVFYSPGCGGCRSLHPEICQLAESNPKAIFLMVNYEKLKTTCHCLLVRVLPFFRFYRGAQGRLRNFSCTISTINKLKVALAKHGNDGCRVGPAKGLDESELMALAAAGELPTRQGIMEDLFLENNDIYFALSREDTAICIAEAE